MSDVKLGTIYELNKQIMIQQPHMSQKDYTHQLTNICSWVSSNNEYKYYMLLNRERADYTVFNVISFDYNKMLNEIREVLDYRGILIDIDYLHGEDYYDIWIDIDNEAFLYKLFPCNDFVIEI